MKNIIPLLLLVAGISATVNAQVFPVQTIQNNGSTANRINYVFLGDGYQSSELPNFITNATAIKNAMFTQAPFSQYSSFFNVYAVQVPSAESNATHAGTATDVVEPASPVIFPNTYFGCRFDVSNIHRLLVPLSTSQALTVAATNVPDYDQVMMISNSTVYGGSGGAIATGSVHSSASEIMIHEIGHSFANLGDEYWFNCAERKNRTANNNPSTIIWKNWLNSNGIGIYPIDANPCYRPHQNCKMKALGAPFCAVCKEAFIDRIYELISPIDAFSPSSNTVTFSGPSMNFDLTLVLPNPNTLRIKWVLNGDTISSNVHNVNITAAQLLSGANTLKALVTDSTALSRAYWPAVSGYLHSVIWTINNTALPVDLLDFEVSLQGNITRLDWQTTHEKNTAYFEVQRSEDGLVFQTIGRVKAAGNSHTIKNYRFDDPAVPDGTTYYRLEMFDLNGTHRYSPVKTVNRIDKLYFSIYPNPSSDKVHILLNNKTEEPVDIQLVDEQGSVVLTQHYEPVVGFNTDLDIQQLAPGNYFLLIQMGQTHLKQVIQKVN